MEYTCKCKGAARPSRSHLILICVLPTSSLYSCKSCGAAWEWRSKDGWDLILLPSLAEDDEVDLAEAES